MLTFYSCGQYRFGAPNDERFFIYGQDRFKQYGIKWGEFYLIEGSDWQTDFPDLQIANEACQADKMKRFLFYFKDETFECVAESYDFSVNNKITAGNVLNDQCGKGHLGEDIQVKGIESL